MPPYLIIICKLDEANHVELPVHFADDIDLWVRRMRRIGFDACDAKVYIYRGQRFFNAIENRCVLGLMIWYLMSHVPSAGSR